MNCSDTHLPTPTRFRWTNMLLGSLAALSLSLGASAGQPDPAASTTNVLATPSSLASASPTQKPLTAEQQTEMQARIDLANTIVQNVSEDAVSKGANETWRMGLLGDLYKLPSTRLRDIAQRAISLQDARTLSGNAAAQGIVAKAQLGDTSDSLVFNPVTPCRYVDTRNGGSPITSTPTTFNTIYGGGQYGGIGCVFYNPYALAANFTVVVNGGPAGYLVLRSTGSTATTSFINWSTGGTPALANAGIITLGAVNGGGYGFDALTSGNTTAQLIVDVFGYFGVAQTNATPFDCQVNFGAQYQLAANEIVLVASPTCPSGYTAITAECFNESTSDVYLIGSGFQSGSGGTNAFCQWRNSTAHTNDSVLSGVNCCRTAAQ